MLKKMSLSVLCLMLAASCVACAQTNKEDQTTTGTDDIASMPNASQEGGTDDTQGTQEAQENVTVTSTFDSDGDLISGWYWVRDSTLADYAAWTISGVPINTTVTFPMTVLATDGAGGGPGHDAAFRLYFGPASASDEWQQFPYEDVTLPNVSPATDPVGYTCTGDVSLPIAAVGGSTTTLYVRAVRTASEQNHIAFNAESISTTISTDADDTGNDGTLSDDDTWNNDGTGGHNYGDTTDDDPTAGDSTVVDPDTDGDGVTDTKEQLFGTLLNNPDSDGDGIVDGDDLSPLMNPSEPALNELQKVGMVRVEQPVKAFGIDGWARKYHLNVTYRCKYFVCWPTTTLVFDELYEDEGTRASTMSLDEYKKALDKVFTGDKFTAYKVEDTTPSAVHVEATEDGHDYDEENGSIYEASILHPNQYEFFYDYLYDFVIAYLKNTNEMRYPSDSEFFRYALYPVKLTPGYDQSISLQFTDQSMYDALSYTETNTYRIPAFMYSFYSSNDFDNDGTVPYHEGLALGMIESEGQFIVSIRIPAAKAVGQSYVKITPVWLSKNGLGNLQKFDAMVPSWDIKGLTRDTTYLKDENGNSEIVTEYFRTWDGLNTTSRTIASFTSNQAATDYQVEDSWIGMIKRDTSDDSTDDDFTVLDIAQTVITYVDQVGGLATNAADYTKSFVTATNKVDELDDLPATHWARSSKYSTATAGVSSATGIISLVTDGYDAYTAIKNGETVDVVYYSAKTGLDLASLAPNLVEVAEKGFGYTGKATKLSCLGAKKAAAGLAVAVGVVEVTYDIYRLANTDDPILETAYSEKIASDVIDTGISVAAVFSPHTLVFQITWTVEAEIYAAIFGEDFAYKVAQSPGSAVVFLAEYFFTDIIPSQIAEDVYTGIRDDVIEEIENFNSVQLPYLTLFIDPDL